MAFCEKCGVQLNDGLKFCPECGAPVNAAPPVAPPPPVAPVYDAQPQQTPPQQSKVEAAFNQFNNTEDTTADFDPEDVSSNKIMGVLAYLSWLVLIPIFAAKESKFARFHVNQGLVLAITEIVWGIIYRVIRAILPYGALYTIFGVVGSIVSIIFLVISIIGIINAVKGKAKALPLIGSIKLIK